MVTKCEALVWWWVKDVTWYFFAISEKNQRLPIFFLTKYVLSLSLDFPILLNKFHYENFPIYTNCMKVKVLVDQSCLTLCSPMDCSPLGSSVHGILQTKILEWVTVPSSRGIFLTQESNPGLLHCMQILYSVSHQGSQKW